MLLRTISWIGILLISSFFSGIIGQPNCITSVGAIYGSPTKNERAKCVLATPGNDGLYAIGMREDSVLIVKLNLLGQILWAKTFDIVPGEVDNVTTAIVDGEGMIVTMGIAGDYTDGGNVFAFRFNPNSNQVLWAKEYVNSTMRNYAFAIVQKPNGNYLLGLNPHPPLPGTTNDDELLEVSKATGSPISGMDKIYNLGGSDAMSEIIIYQNFLYAIGRYTDGAPNNKMRVTISKTDLNTLGQVWVKMGHINSAGTARLYGKDLIIDQDLIYSIGQGDPAGTSTTNTKQYLQKSDINGNLIWLNQYDLPGTNDVCHQLIKSGTGLVVLAGKNASPSDIVLYKVDLNGAMLWAKQYQFSPVAITSIQVDRGNSQVIEVGSNLFITATGVTSNGTTDMLIIRTDLNGVTDMPCVTTVPVTVPVIAVASPVFYTVSPVQSSGSQTVTDQFPDIIQTPFTYRVECIVSDTIFETINAVICPGESYEGYTIAGTYQDFFNTSNGCDSVRTLYLNIYTPVTTSEQATICLGESYNGYSVSGVYSQTFQNFLGCDSIHILTLNVVPLFNNLSAQICEGQSYMGYTETGFYTDTIQGPPNECDTIQFLNLTVVPPETTMLDAVICDGESYEGYTSTGIYTDVFITSLGCDSIRILDLTVSIDDFTEEDVEICLGETYNGYSQSGMYTSTYQNIYGCDSTHTINLSVIPLENNLFISICEGDQYAGYTSTGFYIDTLQGPPGECDTIRYLDLIVNIPNETSISVSICTGDEYEGYTTSGVYTDVFSNQYGCDSTRILDLTVTSAITTDIDVIICEGETYEGYSMPGTYTDIFTSVFGCDSIRILTLVVGVPEINASITICDGESYLGFNTPGNYTVTLPGTSGACDTILYLELMVTPLYSFSIDQTICTGGNYLGYNSTGVYIDTLVNPVGCDSVRTLTLTVLDELISNVQITICHGAFYEGHNVAGIYVDTFTSVFGCDSIRTLDLELTFPTKVEDISLCSGGSFEGHTQAGTYLDTIYGLPGNCDTLQQLTISIIPPLLTYINAAVCSGQSFLGYNQSGMYADTFQTVDGCDSVRMLNLTVDDQIETSELVSICSGQTYQGYSMAGIYVDTFTSVFGCDSIRQLELIITDPMLLLEISICQGDTYLGHTQPGIYQDTLQGTLLECDTIRHLTLTVLPIIESMNAKSICSGQSLEGYSVSGIYIDTFQTAGGCDSVRILDLQVSNVIMASINKEICFGQSFEGYADPGIYADTFSSVFGCDSIRQLTLTVNAPEKHLIIEICAGQIFESYTQTGIYLDTILGVAGSCDTLREINLTIEPPATTVVNQTICEGEIFLGYSQPGTYIDTLLTSAGCDSIRQLHLVRLDAVMTTMTSSICDQILPQYNQPGVYIDTFVSYRGCDSIQRTVIEDAGLYIPNVFSPNDDGVNDVFTVFPYPDVELGIEYFAIFDRFGDMVYETTSWPIIWKGTDHDGKKFQPAVFAYVLKYYCNNKTEIKHGDITLVK